MQDNFSNKTDEKEAIKEKPPTEDIGNYDVKSEPSTMDGFIPRGLRNSKEKRVICSVCSLESSDDQKPFNNGGLARCSAVNAFNKLEHSMNIKLKDQENEYNTASKRLEILLSRASLVIKRLAPTSHHNFQCLLWGVSVTRFFSRQSCSKSYPASFMNDLILIK